ncbi:uncharacterized protein HMPREF1541_10602 [Cyphellophora europaea CBS 101466]|uniref:Cyclin-like domain-containing protein n=1 Tax=Cyphellophora europaea (strain CBS 101466) TaxID=1220924 RepID=W2S6U6_CYPE1|nr:uncharacterized protein HMPREF1541_10602 [Cyphellophora europaea CBS 101466]ETN44421.1 hypothetical protein HMPREF1541_10602 [Cyphellophora europaea CBS 101466]
MGEEPPQAHDECQQKEKEPTPPLPPAPQPEKDSGIVPSVKSPDPDSADAVDPDSVDVFQMTPIQALKLLCNFVETLVRMTGDVPPTPPVRSGGQSPAPGMSGLRYAVDPEQAKENAGFGPSPPAQVDGVAFVKAHIGSPEAHPQEPTSVIGADAQPVHVQHGIIARKFWSKRPPGIPLMEYLMRMHKYCAMSTAVYLATAYYIARLAVHDRLLPVTPRNVHRLVLAGLRVSMKALEDMCWPHSRFAKVGGVTESELGRLEVTFLFLMAFELKVDEATLAREAESLARGARGASDLVLLDGPSAMELTLPTERRQSKGGEKRKASSVLPSRPAIQVNNGAMGSAAIEVMGQS